MAALWLTYSGCVWSAYGVYSATVQSYNKSIIALPRVGQYGKIFSSLVLYCPSLRSGQYCHHQAEYFPILPSQSCNNIYVLTVQQSCVCHKYTVYKCITCTNVVMHLVTVTIAPAYTCISGFFISYQNTYRCCVCNPICHVDAL